jgi:hypothetical protein
MQPKMQRCKNGRPKRKAIVQEVSKNGGLHPIYIEDNKVNVIRQLINSTSETPTLKVTSRQQSASNITKTPDESEALFFVCNIAMYVYVYVYVLKIKSRLSFFLKKI